ncbi:ABATE domain-containing protein [Nocardia sp. NPDC051030]|uniref:CGNR zinc finger domain-containing protein n=1 Tax=Nocardia sp. NPDC051030 TaxID=3155162 RepID=UPI003441A4D5
MSWTDLIGEPLPLDLINTVVTDADGEKDLLPSNDALREWITAEQSRLTMPEGPVSVEAVRTLRDHVAAAVQSARLGERPPNSALEAITSTQRAAPGYRAVVWDGSAVTATLRRDGSPTEVLLAELAEATAVFLADPSITKIRQCEGPTCRQLFLPATARRRWCSPALCGNRVRVARYYQNHKG